MNIKKAICLLLIFSFAFTINFACAEESTFKIADLREHTMKKWEKEYTAYGRTISVNVSIQVPQLDSIQIHIVEPMPLLSEEKRDEMEKKYMPPDNSNTWFEFRNKKNQTLLVYNNPYLLSDDNFGGVRQSSSRLLQYDLNKSYAENNELTVKDALQITNNKVSDVYDDIDISLRDVVIYGCLYQSGTSKRITEKGYYNLMCTQTINGVPLAASIHQAYRYGKSIKDLVLSKIGTVSGNVINDESYYIDCNLWNVIDSIDCNISYITFDTIIPKIEEKIFNGNIRNVYHAQLGFVQYDIEENEQEQYAIVPCWIVWVDWLPTATDELEIENENEAAFFTETYTYLPLVINAVTGEMSDPADIGNNRMQVPHPFDVYINEFK